LLVWRFHNLSAVMCAIPIAAAVYLLLVRKLGVLNPNDAAVLGRVIAILPGKLGSIGARTLRWICPAT
jgi:hypothetical protein